MTDPTDKHAVDGGATRQRRKKRRLHAWLFRRFWQLCVLLLALLATYVTAGRLLMPLVAGQIPVIERSLSGALGIGLSIGALEGSWFRLSPGIEITGLELRVGLEQTESLSVGRAFVTLDVPQSLRRGQPVIGRLNMSGFQVVLQEDAGGGWMLAGLDGTGAGYLDQIMDVLLETGNLALSESLLELRRYDGTVITADSVFVDMRNSGEQHEVRMQFRINGQASPSRLMLELAGDPRREFSASAHLTTSGLDLLPLLPAVAGGWRFSRSGASGSIWVELDQHGIKQLDGSVTGVSVQATDADGIDTIALENGAFLVRAVPERKADASVSAWKADIAELAFDWQQTPWDVAALQLTIPADPAATLAFSAAALDVQMLTQMLEDFVQFPASASEILTTLAPRGRLLNLNLQTALDGSYPQLFRLRSNFAALEVAAWNGAPAGNNLQGYLEAGAGSGFAEVEGNRIDLHLPLLFPEPWHFDSLTARVGWSYGAGELRVSSNAIQVANSDLLGSVQFDLQNSRDTDGDLRSELALLIGMETMDVAARHQFLPVIERLRPTMDWLDAALQAGTIRDSGFVLRTSTQASAPANSASLSSWYHVEGGVLKFLPDWPVVENIIGDVRVFDGVVDVRTATASIGGLTLEPFVATLQPVAEGGNLLVVRGAGTASTGAGLDFLRNTPIRNATGTVLDSWQADGSIRAMVDLQIPLGIPDRSQQIAVDVDSSGSTLQIVDHALEINDINGRIRYRSDTGLTADGLESLLFGAPLTADIETLADAAGARITRISGNGHAEVTALRNWEGQSTFVRRLLDYATGGLDYRATLDVHGPQAVDGVRTRLVLQSGMRGMASSLPEPFDRAAEVQGDLQLDLAFRDEDMLLGLRFNELVSGQLVLDQDGVDRGQVYVGALNRDFTARQSDSDMPGLLVNGALPDFDFEAWQDLVAGMAADDGTTQPLEDYLRLVDVNIGTLQIAGQQLQDINVQVEPVPEGLQIRGLNTTVAGSITIPADPAGAWIVNLDYLRFPPRPERIPDEAGQIPEEEEIDLLVDVDPTKLHAFDFTTAEISIGSDNLGAYSFRFRPGSAGASIADFRMQSPDANITDRQGTGGANIDWRYRSGLHNSSFNGLFQAGNLGRVLPAWGHDAFVESQSGSFSGTLQWQGSPLAFALKNSSGQILMDLNNGRFVNINAGSSRLVGALNFDSLARRLQLDFSDLFQRGFAYDRISGNLNFEKGVVTPNGGILIDGPSSRITINGEIDLAARTIAADMLVRIPLGQNISMLAGILGAWPIALSTYLASKIFQDQVEDFATVIYRLDGPWDNPTAGFEAPTPTGTATGATP